MERHNEPRRVMEKEMPDNEFPTDLPLLTTDQAIEFIREELGVPITKSTFEKKGMQGEGPAVARYYGRRKLYSRPVLREWGLALSTSEPAILVTDSDATAA